MKEFIETTVGTLLVLLLIAAMVGVATLLGACAGPVPITVVRVMPPEPSTGRPTCMVVMSPPPTPPISYNELAYRCRDPEGRKLAADDLCMTTAEVTEMSRFTAHPCHA